MEQPVVSPPKQMQDYWRGEVIRRHPDMVQAYLERHNLEELPLPEYVTPDTAIYYRQIDGVWETLRYPGVTHGLAAAVGKDWLMAPPDSGVETLEDGTTVATGRSDREVGLQALADTLGKRDAREKQKAKPFGCTVKGCRRRFDTERGVNKHISVKHRKEKLK
jgi:hypothetical protein